MRQDSRLLAGQYMASPAPAAIQRMCLPSRESLEAIARKSVLLGKAPPLFVQQLQG